MAKTSNLAGVNNENLKDVARPTFKLHIAAGYNAAAAQGSPTVDAVGMSR